ncbi:MAG TPA: hypothetical protein VE664_05175, partial [Actinomycetes bacterium]|nr:hypothetical protein [Actinomycetes bacterium]
MVDAALVGSIPLLAVVSVATGRSGTLSSEGVAYGLGLAVATALLVQRRARRQAVRAEDVAMQPGEHAPVPPHRGGG